MSKPSITSEAIKEEAINIFQLGKTIIQEIFIRPPENLDEVYINKILLPILSSEQNMDLQLVAAYRKGEIDLDLDVANMIAELGINEPEDKDKAESLILALIFAMDAIKQTDEITAWKKLLHANYVIGTIYSAWMSWGKRGKYQAKRSALIRNQKTYGEDKEIVKYWWDKWQRDPSLYRLKKDFDEAMLDKAENTTNIRTIQGWRRELEKGGTLY